MQLVADVLPYEQMKLRLLNGSHQLLAYAGLLLGYQYVHEAITDPLLRSLASAYMSRVARPTLGDVPGIDLSAYEQQIVDRLENTAIADTLQRVATDGSDRVSRFLVPVVQDLISLSMPLDIAAFALATFAVVCAAPGLREAIPDRQRDRLDIAVGHLPSDPGAILDDPVLFGSVGESGGFRASFESYCSSIYASGVRSAGELALRSIAKTEVAHAETTN